MNKLNASPKCLQQLENTMILHADMEILTERLKLVPVNENYKFDIWNESTPEVTEFLPFDRASTVEGTQGFIDFAKQQLIAGKEMAMMILSQNNDEFIGCCGLHAIDSESACLGIWLKSAAHGLGYGTEAVRGLVSFAKDQMGLSYVSYNVEKENPESIHISEKLGFTFYREFKEPKGDIKIRNMIEMRQTF